MSFVASIKRIAHPKFLQPAVLFILLQAHPLWAAANSVLSKDGPALFGISLDFILFGGTLIGIALFHHHTLKVALGGFAVISAYKIIFTGFRYGQGVPGWISHLQHEGVLLTNLLLLLLGFALLSKHFEESKVPAELPKFLPNDWKGGFVLLLIVFVLSSFLDNIAAAVIGGTMANVVFRGQVHIGYLAAIVAASNAGGTGSVVGDTTTTMMWIDGVSPPQVLKAYVAAAIAMVIFGIPSALQQHKFSPIANAAPAGNQLDWLRVGIIVFILLAAIVTSVVVNLCFNKLAYRFPFIGIGVWLAILLSAPLRHPDWKLLPEAFKGSIFLLSLVLCASMMPVEKLPAASWQMGLGLGFVSSVFDNIPLTALALKQGGYDWGFLAYAVGFGGSMIWFGSSAGVALSNMYPEVKSVGAYLRHGWYVAVAYVIGYAALLMVLGWHPEPKHM
jgi:Na+/H+ antiporter NhaD/arsenite permease-like protein